MKYYGIIDLGTNTFHLLIATWTPETGFEEVYRERRFVKLAEGGADYITQTAYKRALHAVIDYKSVLDQHAIQRLQVIGTAALRTAVNGRDFIREVAAKTGLKIELISGEEEARLIHLGVRQIVPLNGTAQLIMDIGGGSVEFIIADSERVFWAQSFPVGVAVLFHRFHNHEPITEKELTQLRQYLDETLQPLRSALERFPVRDLIGASGTFDVLADLLANPTSGPPSFEVSRLQPVYRLLYGSTRRERMAMEEVPASRADMIVVAMALLQHVLEMCRAQRIIVSEYALKEGLLYEMVNEV